MKTKRTISNISYNTLDHFEKVVSRLVSRGVIEWCYWVQHQAEEDELKDHIHFVLQPSGQLETAQLEKEFYEIDPTNAKPLGVTKKWNYTSGEDGMSNWLLYCMHHSGYLASKGQYRRYHYGPDEFGSTDPDAFREDLHKINFMQFVRLQALADAVSTGKPFALLVQEGIVPINLRAQFQQQYNELAKLKYNEQTGRMQSHEEDVFVQEVNQEAVQVTIEDTLVQFTPEDNFDTRMFHLSPEEEERLSAPKTAEIPDASEAKKKQRRSKKISKEEQTLKLFQSLDDILEPEELPYDAR